MAEGNGRTWSPDIKEIGDKIAALTVSKAVELGDYDGGARRLGVRERGHELRSIGAFAAFDLDVFLQELPAATIEVVVDSFALRLDAKTGLTLLVCRNA